MLKTGVCLEMFFTDKPFLDRIEMAGKLGVQHAEMWFIDGTFDGKDCSSWPKDPKSVRRAAQEAGLSITNAVIGSPDGSIGGGLTAPAKRAQWLERAEETLSFCSEAGIPAAIVCAGNLVARRGRAQMRQSVLEGLRATAELAEKHGVDLWLEPLNDKIDHPGYFLTSSAEGAALCRETSSPRLKLLFDCYHMQIMEGDLCGHIKRNLDVIAHVHSAGHPGRHELWLGETNYPLVASKLEEWGYKGVFSLEYLPSTLRRAWRRPCAFSTAIPARMPGEQQARSLRQEKLNAMGGFF